MNVFQFLYSVLLLSASFFYSFAEKPIFSLPFQCGEEMVVTQGYNGEGGGTNPSHTKHDCYALDFSENGCNAWLKSAIAAEDGIVEIVNNNNSNSGYGRYVIIYHGDNYYTIYGHLNETTVLKGQCIRKGQEVGKIGNTGFGYSVSNNPSCAEHPNTHLHFAVYQMVSLISNPSQTSDFKKTGILPEPLSNNKNIHFGNKYISDNCLNESTGIKVGEFSDGWHYPVSSSSPDPYSSAYTIDYYLKHFYSSYNLLPSTYVHNENDLTSSYWIQDFTTNTIDDLGIVTMVFNPYQFNNRTKCYGVVYHIHGQIRSYWLLNRNSLGYPVTDEYYWDNNNHRYTVQWFEKSDKNYTALCYDRDLGGSCFLGKDIGLLPTSDLIIRINENNTANSGCEDGGCGAGGITIDDYPNLDTINLKTYPFQLGFTPVQKSVGEFDGLVLCKDTMSADSLEPEVYHKLPIDTSSVFSYGNDVYYFGMYRHMNGKFRLRCAIKRDGVALWDNLNETDFLNTGNDVWDYCPHITRETKPLPGNYEVSYYLDEGNGLELMTKRNYSVVSSTIAEQRTINNNAKNEFSLYYSVGQLYLFIRDDQYISLKIYNLCGKQVRHISGFYPSGHSRLHLALNAGCYIVNFNNNTFKFRTY